MKLTGNISKGLLPLTFFAGYAGTNIVGATGQQNDNPPNFILIFCDDLGYGDLGCFGSEVNRTPNIDRMASDGIKLTDFYAAASVSTPSRAGLLTGCYPQRVDMAETKPRQFRSVLLPAMPKGLNPKEITIAEALKEKQYATACIGKWHVGDQAQFLPTRQGFDYYYGIPYSNNMSGKHGVPLLQNETVIEQPVDQNTITKRYTEETIRFISKNKDKPFFVYLPHTMPHAPLHASSNFAGKSKHGIYSDAIEELDWSVGEIINYLKKNNLDKNTLVFFTSDNGGAAKYGGVNKPLRGGKGTLWEGGIRVPAIAWYPGKIPAGTETNQIASVIDFLPTFYHLACNKSFDKAIIDGHNIWPLLTGKCKQTPYQAFFYYDRDQLQAVRSGKWKLHLPLEKRFISHAKDKTFAIDAELYNLEEDIAEKNNLAEQHPEIVKQLTGYAVKARKVLGDTDKPSPYMRRAGMVSETYILKK